MDRLELRRVHPLSAPGLTPGLLGIALAVASVMLISQALRKRPFRTASLAPTRTGEADRGATQRLLLCGALCLVYALGLVGSLPFWLATAVFVSAFIVLFEWEAGAPAHRRMIALAWATGLGLAAGGAISYVFRDLFFVRLP
jgi:putative tricarboxylic transport membrane protein